MSFSIRSLAATLLLVWLSYAGQILARYEHLPGWAGFIFGFVTALVVQNLLGQVEGDLKEKIAATEGRLQEKINELRERVRLIEENITNRIDWAENAIGRQIDRLENHGAVVGEIIAKRVVETCQIAEGRIHEKIDEVEQRMIDRADYSIR